jgi:predicted PurR-regulated permease PerM
MISFSVLVGIIVVIGILFYRVMVTFLLPLFLAALLVVIFRPLHEWYLKKCKGRPRLAAGLTTASVMIIVLVPATVAFTLAATEASSLVGQFNNHEIRQKLTALRTSLGLQLPFADELKYFEASFETLREDAAVGVTAPVDQQSLKNLYVSLIQFHAQILESRQAERAPAIEEIASIVERASQGQHASVSYRADIFDAAQRFRRFKVNLLGGEYQSRLKEMVNPATEDLERLQGRLFAGAPDWFRSVGGATGSIAIRMIVGLVIMVISLHFFLVDGPTMISSLMRLSPLDDRHEQELVEEFDRVSRAVVVATLLSAVVQGVLAGVGFAVAGLGSIFLLMVLTAVFALIPFVGAAAIWVPAALYLFFIEERYVAAVVLAVYGAGVVSMADNVIKPMVLHDQSNLHPLLALLSVLGGVQALGPIGVLVGPMVVVFLQTLLNILHRELTALDREEEGKGKEKLEPG